MPKLRNGSKGGFKPGLPRLRVKHSTAELPRSTAGYMSSQVLEGLCASPVKASFNSDGTYRRRFEKKKRYFHFESYQCY